VTRFTLGEERRSTARRVRSSSQSNQELGEGAALWVAPELSDPVGSIEVGQHQDVEQFGAGSRSEGVEAFPESALELIRGQGPPSPALANLDFDQQGFAWLPEDDFVHHFAADVDPVRARVMHAVQQPLAGSTLQEVMGVPAWKSLPSWFLIADGDQAIPPDAERQFAGRMGATTVEVSTSHVAMVSHPDDVVNLIKRAAEAAPVTS